MPPKAVCHQIGPLNFRCIFSGRDSISRLVAGILAMGLDVDLNAANCILEVWVLYDVCLGNSGCTVDDAARILTSKEPETMGKWTFTGSLDEASDTVTIEATYNQ